MKTYLILMFIFMTILLSGQEVKRYFNYTDREGKTKYGAIIEDDYKVGFRIGFVYFLTDRKTARHTLFNNKRNYYWNVWVKINRDFVMVDDPVQILTILNENNEIEFVITSRFQTSLLNYIYFRANFNQFVDLF